MKALSNDSQVTLAVVMPMLRGLCGHDSCKHYIYAVVQTIEVLVTFQVNFDITNVDVSNSLMNPFCTPDTVRSVHENLDTTNPLYNKRF